MKNPLLLAFCRLFVKLSVFMNVRIGHSSGLYRLRLKSFLKAKHLLYQLNDDLFLKNPVNYIYGQVLCHGKFVTAKRVHWHWGEKLRILKYFTLYTGRNRIHIRKRVASKNTARNMHNIPLRYQLQYGWEYWWYSVVFAEQNTHRILEY